MGMFDSYNERVAIESVKSSDMTAEQKQEAIETMKYDIRIQTNPKEEE